MRSIIFVLLQSILISNLYSQVLNIDREGLNDSIYKPWMISSSFALTSDKQKNNIIDVSSNFEINRNLKNNYTIIGIIKNDGVYYGKTIIQNEGQFQLRYRDLDKRKISMESYLQYQWNGAWGMEYRKIIGSNIRFRFLEKRKADLYAAVGLFNEREKWNWQGVSKELVPINAKDISKKVYRLNTYFKYSIKLIDKLDLSTISYIQYSLNNNFLKPRWYLESNLYVEANKHLHFLVHWDHIRDNNRYVPIDKFYYSFSTGIQINY